MESSGGGCRYDLLRSKGFLGGAGLKVREGILCIPVDKTSLTAIPATSHPWYETERQPKLEIEEG